MDKVEPAFRNTFSNIVRLPGHAGSGVFSDLGAWHGFANPDKGYAGGFAGPYVHGEFLHGHWMSPNTLVRFTPLVSTAGTPRERLADEGPVRAQYVPGALRQEFTLGDFQVASELIFIGPRVAAVRVKLTNAGDKAARVVVQFNGTASVPLETGSSHASVLARVANTSRGMVQAEVRFDPALNLTARAGLRGYLAKSTNETVLAPDETGTAYYTISLGLNDIERVAARGIADAFFASPLDYFSENKRRWQKYMDAVVSDVDEEATLPQRVAVKAVSTLVFNWRGATGADLLHDGCVPSMVGYNNGFWSWDSWKHAAALALFAPELAASQVYAMFDYQAKDTDNYVGMIPDKIGLPPARGQGWGNSKPPLAAWAAWLVYYHGRDEQFLRDLFPRLEKYHTWWYENRDHDGNGLCEFGSTDDSTAQMKWESGMDNAPRFDGTAMLQNAAHAWSADQESVDLNSFLYAEKRLLATMAGKLGMASKQAVYESQAKDLRKLAQARFFDKKRGYFFDRQLGSKGAFVGPMACEGFAPLWSGLASPEQAASVRGHLLDRRKFRTRVPLPSVAADEPAFSAGGYWRGPVWLDQAYFALHGLRRYGFEADARAILGDLLAGAEGLGSGEPGAPLAENYDPHTGRRQGIEYFGWTAAHLLLLTAEERPPEPPRADIPDRARLPERVQLKRKQRNKVQSKLIAPPHHH